MLETVRERLIVGYLWNETIVFGGERVAERQEMYVFRG